MEIRYERGGLINNGIEKFLEKSAREEFSISCSPTFAVGSRIIFGKWKICKSAFLRLFRLNLV